MKAKKIFIYLLLALPALFLQSCLTDQEDVFDASYSERMEKFLQQAQDTLVKAQYGWALDYYPQISQAYGGVAYTIRFTRDNAIVRYENKPDDGEVKSLYRMKEDSGPVLSFDTYNTFLHTYATPRQGEYRGMEGDFEFVVDSIGSDRIKIHGKRSLNTMYLRKLSADAAEYMEKVTELTNIFVFSEMNLNIGGKPYTLAFTDTDRRQLALYDGTTRVLSSAYAFTDKGIRLYKPFTVNGVQVYDLTFDAETAKLSAAGIETAESFVDVDAVAKIIDEISVSNGSRTITKTIPYLDKVSVSCDASWVHITKEGNRLAVTVDANPNATQARGAKLKVSNGKDEAQVQVLQFDLPALLGNYQLTMTSNVRDNSGNMVFTQNTRTARIRYTGSGNNRKYYLDVTSPYGANYVFELIYVDSAHSFLMQSGQKVITLGNSTTTYYIGNAFNIDANRGTATSNSFYNLISFNIADNGDISASLCGPLFISAGGRLQYTELTTERIVLWAYTGEPFTSENLAGWWDRWLNPVLTKKASGSSPAKPSESLDEHTDGGSSAPALVMQQYMPNRVARFDVDWNTSFPTWNKGQVTFNK